MAWCCTPPTHCHGLSKVIIILPAKGVVDQSTPIADQIHDVINIMSLAVFGHFLSQDSVKFHPFSLLRITRNRDTLPNCPALLPQRFGMAFLGWSWRHARKIGNVVVVMVVMVIVVAERCVFIHVLPHHLIPLNCHGLPSADSLRDDITVNDCAEVSAGHDKCIMRFEQETIIFDHPTKVLQCSIASVTVRETGDHEFIQSTSQIMERQLMELDFGSLEKCGRKIDQVNLIDLRAGNRRGRGSPALISYSGSKGGRKALKKSDT